MSMHVGDRERPARDPVLLLGSTGFLGRVIHAELERGGHPVCGVGSSTLDLRRPESLEALKQLVKPDMVVIMAAAVMRERADSTEAFESHIAILARVAQLLSQVAVRKCLYMSTTSVYGDHATNEAITEETLTDPTTQYAMAKLAGELLIRQAAEISGTPTAVLRSCRFYGPGDPHVGAYGPARFIKSALEHQRIELFGNGEERRDYLFVDDVVRIVRRFAENAEIGVYNLVSGQGCSFAALAGLIQRLMPEPVRVLSRARIRPVSHQDFVPEKIRAACPDLVWTPLEEGLAVTVAASPARYGTPSACGLGRGSGAEARVG